MSKRSGLRSRYFRIRCCVELRRRLGLTVEQKHELALDIFDPGEDTGGLDQLSSAAAERILEDLRGTGALRVRWSGDYENPNTAPPIVVDTAEGEAWEYDLRLGGRAGAIQPGDRGAQNILLKCLGLREAQNQFNRVFEQERTRFYQELLELLDDEPLEDPMALRGEVRKVTARLLLDGESVRAVRGCFLGRLRDHLHTLLESMARSSPDALRDYRPLLLTHPQRRMLVAGFCKGRPEVISVGFPERAEGTPVVGRLGRDTVRISFNNLALSLRLKFENDHLSAVKLAVAYQPSSLLPGVTAAKNYGYVKSALAQLADVQGTTTDGSTHVGACFEILVALYLLQETEAENRSPEMSRELLRQASGVTSITMNRLLNAAPAAARFLRARLQDSVPHDLIVEYVMHDPRAYAADPLETRDISVGFRSDRRLTEIGVSLKAVARITKEIGTKNPGAGTLLGPTYFGLVPDKVVHEHIAEIKMEFLDSQRIEAMDKAHSRSGTNAHSTAMRRFADYLEQTLRGALEDGLQRQLLCGLSALVGRRPILIAAYGGNPSLFWFDPQIATSQEVHAIRRTRDNTITVECDRLRYDIRVKFVSATRHVGQWSNLKAFVTIRMQGSGGVV